MNFVKRKYYQKKKKMIDYLLLLIDWWALTIFIKFVVITIFIDFHFSSAMMLMHRLTVSDQFYNVFGLRKYVSGMYIVLYVICADIITL